VSPDLVLGLDAGTTAVKAAAFDADGNQVAQGRSPTPWRAVPTGAEVDPDELLEAAVAAAREAVAAAGGGRVVAVGVSGMAETGVLLDADGRPVVPAIAWHDARGEAEAARLAADLPDFPARAGLPATPLCTLVKYRWMRGHLPAVERGVRWLNVAEWLVAGFGGEPVAELSLASRTGFYDLHARAPWDAALEWAGAPAGLVGEAVPAGTPMGRVGDALPEARGAVLTVGGHDHLSAAVLLGPPGNLQGLSLLDLRILGLLVEGVTDIRGLARALHVTRRTVVDSLGRGLAALRTSNLTAATVRALRGGMRIPPGVTGAT